MTEHKNENTTPITPPEETPTSIHIPPANTEVKAPEPAPHTPNLTPKKTHRVRNASLAVGALILFLVIGLGYYLYTFAQNTIVDVPEEEQVSFVEQVQRIVDTNAEPLSGEEDDRIDILLLGQGGLNHPGGTLVDTIIVMSIKPSTNQVGMLSIPRDLVVPYSTNPAYPEYYKINNAVVFGGIEQALQSAEDVTGEEMDYYLLVDFTAFRDVIDTLGGVNVNVPVGFTDSQYPDYNYGYQTIRFATGEQTMDGETALQYSRSRHGNNGQGSDFARAQRQQLVIEAVRNKALSASTILNPGRVSGLLNDLGDHVSTNMQLWEMARFAEMARDIDTTNIKNEVVQNGPEGVLHSEIADQTGAYILVPDAGLGDFSEIHVIARNIFDIPLSTTVGDLSHTLPQPEATVAEEAGTGTDEGTVSTADEIATAQTTVNQASVSDETAIVTIQNGSTIEGLAGNMRDELLGEGVNVIGVANAVRNTTQKTRVYDLSGGAHPATAAVLQETLGVDQIVSATLPSSTTAAVRASTDVDPNTVNVNILPENTDFIVLLGFDAPELSGLGGGATTIRVPQ